MHHGRLMEVASREEAGSPPGSWRPPIYKTVATRREGIPELAAAIVAHRAYLDESGQLEWRQRARAAAELETIVQQDALRRVLARIDGSELDALLRRIARREIDPYTASQQLLEDPP